MQAMAPPPVEYHSPLRPTGWSKALVVAAVVETVSVAATEPLVMFTGLVDPKLKVGGYWAPAGPEVIVAVNATLPVKPPVGTTVMVELFPVVAPGAIVTGVPLRVKLGLGAIVSVNRFDVLVRNSAVPWYVADSVKVPVAAGAAPV